MWSTQHILETHGRGDAMTVTYIDDVMTHSVNEELHKSHLEQAFQGRMTFRGSKCKIGMAQVAYLGHTFSGEGMSPDSSYLVTFLLWGGCVQGTPLVPISSSHAVMGATWSRPLREAHSTG